MVPNAETMPAPDLANSAKAVTRTNKAAAALGGEAAVCPSRPSACPAITGTLPPRAAASTMFLNS